MKSFSILSVLVIAALLPSATAYSGLRPSKDGEAFSVREYEEFHDVLHPLEHEALPKKDFARIRSRATELVKLGKEIIKLGVPQGTAREYIEEFRKELKNFGTALAQLKAAKTSSDQQLKLSYSAVHDSFEMLAGMLPRKMANWSSFRGDLARGVAEGQNIPEQWDGRRGVNIKWKTRIPGLAHSSPVVWGESVFVTTAISSRGGDTFRHGLYGDGTASEDRSLHQWKVYAIDKNSGRILWERTAFEGVPREKRHIKASYANSTPATDGRYLVTFFGSQGLYAFDLNGRLLWKKDLGILNAGAYDAPDYEWGTASSPIIYKDLVIVQCDTQTESFLLAVDVKNGKTVWKANREELPSWGTPTIYPGEHRVELIANASNFIRGYDPNTGKELWRLGGSSKITAPTPIFSSDLIVVASGRRPEAPIFVIRAGATGDITLAKGQSSNKYVAWSKQARGSYMPTPLIYGNYLYVLSNQGVFDCYDLQSGAEIYRERISHQGGGFSASPVAADGKIYLPSEDGDVFVVRAGPKFESLATNSMGELIMATPAISAGKMFVRSQHHLFAIEQLNQDAVFPASLNGAATYYRLRRDLRRCASPMCGGFFVSRVNHRQTRCFNGKNMNECYVAQIDWNGNPQVDAQRGLVRGHIVTKDYPRFGKLGALRVAESWQSAGDKMPAGILYLVKDRGVRCITHPCPTHEETRLNSGAHRNIAGVDLNGVGASDSKVSEAFEAMTRYGVIVVGSNVPVKGPAGQSVELKATQFYLRNVEDVGSKTNKACIKSGCSSQVCADGEVITTCEWRPEYACYNRARCERQADGKCGFTKTPALTACLASQ